jgi:hexosaminidase
MIQVATVGHELVYAFKGYKVPLTIQDAPRFAWRGLLIDTSRHYLSVNKIKRIIDGISYIKFNTLHWHVVDSQSFPIQIPAYPKLSEAGAYAPHAMYTPDQVKDIIDYAFLRGVRVVFEFDIPGHSTSWGYVLFSVSNGSKLGLS